MPEIVGESALLVDPRDPKQLARGMEKVLVDDSLIRSMGESGLKRVAKYSWDRTARETLKVYCQGWKA